MTAVVRGVVVEYPGPLPPPGAECWSAPGEGFWRSPATESFAATGRLPFGPPPPAPPDQDFDPDAYAVLAGL